ncbi:retrovirus-related pol polyprotein from transposon TNT 1-94 [Tanacetum coccineum]
MNEDKIKKNLEVIETINIKLDHRVSKLIAENEHLKQTYKQLYNSIKPARIRSKEQCDDLINQVNLKSVENFDLNASLQEKVLVITALKDDLRKLKGKALVDNDVTKHPRVKWSNSASGSQPSGNTKKDKIRETLSSTQKNKVEAHHRKVKSSLKNKDCVVQPKGTAHVQHSKLNVNSELKCVTCNSCMLSDNHDLKPRKSKTNVPVSKSKVLKSVSANKKEPCKSWESIVSDVPSSSLDECRSSKLFSVKFGNVHVAKILGYCDYEIGNVMISRVYYVEGLGHNLFSVGKFSRHGLVRGLPKLKFEKDHLCSACAMGKSKKKSQTPKSKDTNQEKRYLLHMDLCGPMHVASVNGKEYILIIVNDFSQFTWVKLLRSKDEAPDFIIKFLKMIQVRLKVPVRRIRTDNGTEFVNQTLREYYEKVGISHETSVARSLQQNGVIERRNHTLIEAARTMLIYAKAPLFLWAEAVATTCYTQNRSIVRLRHGKTPYELLHDKPPDLSFFHVFGALCYSTNDSKNLGMLQPKADIGIFISYVPTKKAFRIYNRRTRQIIETIHVDVDELTAMASEHSSSGPALHEMTPTTISSGLVPNPPPSTPFVPPSRTDWDILFQPLFDELLTHLPSVDLPALEVIAPIKEVVALLLVVSTDSPSSTTVDQDAPSPSNSQTTPVTQSPVIPNDVEEDNHDIEVAHMGNDSYFGILIPEVPSDQSSSTDSIHTIVHPDHQISEHNSKWTKDHPL